MDPNETLKQLRMMVQRAFAITEEGELPDLQDLCEMFDSLDGWISKGGFLPIAWIPGRIACTNGMRPAQEAHQKCAHCNASNATVREYEGGCGEAVCARCDKAMRDQTPDDELEDVEYRDHMIHLKDNAFIVTAVGDKEVLFSAATLEACKAVIDDVVDEA